jgi:hypothetical protein
LSRSRWRRYASVLPKLSLLVDFLPARLPIRTAASPLRELLHALFRALLHGGSVDRSYNLSSRPGVTEQLPT